MRRQVFRGGRHGLRRTLGQASKPGEFLLEPTNPLLIALDEALQTLNVMTALFAPYLKLNQTSFKGANVGCIISHAP